MSKDTKKTRERKTKERLAGMTIKLEGDRLWLDITDIYQFAKRVHGIKQ